MKKILFVCLSFLVINLSQAKYIKKISVVGLSKVSSSSISRFLQTDKDYTEEDESELLVHLYNTGYFSKVNILHSDSDPSELLVNVEENIIIGQVAFEGNKLLKDDVLEMYLKDKLKSGMQYTNHAVYFVIKELHEMYKSIGCYSVKIAPKTIKRSKNVVDVVIEIEENVKSKIKKILFVGNNLFSHIVLNNSIELSERRFWRFWNEEVSIYREDLVAKDSETIKNMYKNKGYLDISVQVLSELSFDQKGYYLTFLINEGKRYKVKDIQIECELKDVDLKRIKKFFQLKKGDWYDNSLAARASGLIQMYIAEEIYPSVGVSFTLDFDRTDNTVVMKYTIKKVEKKFIDRINIKGNIKTLDRIIRRELVLQEGDLLNLYYLRESYYNLLGTGYFETVDIKEEKGVSPDTVNLDCEIKEGNTHSIQFGASASGMDGLGVFVAYVERNFLGRGQVFSANVDWKQKELAAGVSLFEPKFLDSNVGFGVSIDASNRDRRHEYGVRNTGFSVSPYIVYDIMEHLTHTVGYVLGFYKKELKECTDHKKTHEDGLHPHRTIAESVLRKEYGRYTMSELFSALSYSLFNDKYDRSKMCSFSWRVTYAGLGGNVQFWKNDFSTTYTHSLNERVLFIAKAKFGILSEIKNTRVDNRFILGGDGDTLRGFSSYGVGPRDKKTDYCIGGNKYYAGSLMLKTPVSSKELGLNVVGFVDAGNVYGTKYKNIDMNSKLRVSVGVAIEWVKCPLGAPMTIIFGCPIAKHKKDESQVVTLSGIG